MEIEVFEKIKQGDSEAFKEVYEQYNQIYFRVLDRFRGSLEKKGIFKDFQENSVSLIYDWSLSFDSERASFSTYIYNKAFWEFCQATKKPKLEYSYNSGVLEITEDSFSYCIAPDSFEISDDFLFDFSDALSIIKKDWSFSENREIFYDRWIMGFGLEETGEKHGRTGESVRKICDRERERLKVKFNKEGIFENK